MATAINAMSDDEYNLNWGDTNVYDRAKVNWDKYDAHARIRPADTAEQNTDFDGGAHSEAYLNNFNFEIWVDVPLAVNSENSNYDILQRFYLAVDDLKKCFGGTNIAGYYVQYTGWNPKYDNKGDAFFPERISVFCNTWYSQDRTYPEQAGDV